MTSFADVLTSVASYLHADIPLALSADYPFGDVPFGQFPHGGIYPGEGRLLWTLVRLQRPAAVLEIGTHSGGSATIISRALQANERGFLTCLDVDPNAGWLIPDDARPVIRQQTADADLWIMGDPVAAYDFVFEDGAHSKHQVHTLYLNRHKFLKADGIILSHDALIEGVGENVHYGLKEGGAKGAEFYSIDGSPLGISLYCEGTFTPALAEAQEVQKPATRRRKKTLE